MTKKESNDIAIDILTFLHEAKEADGRDAADIANMATEMCKAILKRYPSIRYEIWQWNQESVLDEFNLDYGHAK